jgi:hypothetical protein
MNSVLWQGCGGKYSTGTNFRKKMTKRNYNLTETVIHTALATSPTASIGSNVTGHSQHNNNMQLLTMLRQKISHTFFGHNFEET